MDDDSTKVCDIEEAKAWDDSGLSTKITVDSRQITSWEHLLDVLTSKANNGYQEAEVHTLPSYVL